MTQLQIGEGNRAGNRLRMAQRILRRLEPLAATAFGDSFPVAYAQGTGRMEFAEFVGKYAANEAVLCHVRTRCQDGQPVDVVLFGSMEHVEGFRYQGGATGRLRHLLDRVRRRAGNERAGGRSRTKRSS